MAKPRIFVSSTYYDLRHVRDNLQEFINGMGYEPVLFERGDIFFKPGEKVDESCYREIANCDIFVMIIGGRYGSLANHEKSNTKAEIEGFYGKYNSVCKKEFETAHSKQLSRFLFVEQAVFNEYETYKRNRENRSITYAHVDSINVFLFLEEILEENNIFLKTFSKYEDIESWLKEQWAGFFKELLIKSKESKTVADLSNKIDELNTVTNILKDYSEAIAKKVNVENAQQLIQSADEKIEALKMELLFNEPMIQYFRKCFVDEEKKLHSKTLFNAFQRANSVNELLNSIDAPTSLVTAVNEKQEIAERDFAKYKEKYFGSPVT